MDSTSSPNYISPEDHLVLFEAAVRIAAARTGSLLGDEKEQADAIVAAYSAALRAFELTRPKNPKPE
jgi:hypothetical protein